MGTVFVGGGVILVIFLAVRSLYKDKKSGVFIAATYATERDSS